MRRSWGIGLGTLIAMSCGLVAAPIAPALTEVTPVKCSQLPALFGNAAGAATPGEVAQLPAETCKVNLIATNTNAFTLEGAAGGRTTLEPESDSSPIIKSSEAVAFTLAALSFAGTKEKGAIDLEGASSVTLSSDTFTGDHGGTGGLGVVSIFSAGAALVSDSSFTDDVGTSDGGALFLGGTGTFAVTGNEFNDDLTEDQGGALNIGGTGALTITGNRFDGDVQSRSDDGNGGGGLYLTSGPTTEPVQISENTFDGDLAASEGAGAFIALSQGRPLTVSGNTIENNRITGTNTAEQPREGAGLFIGLLSSGASYSVSQSDNTFAYNMIDETEHSHALDLAAGGAGEWLSGVTLQSTADRFVGNRVAVNEGAPPEGGGIGVIAAAPRSGTPIVPAQAAAFVGRDDLFTDNSTAAGGWGGAIYAGDEATPDCTEASCPPTSLTLEDSTLIDNGVDPGSGSEGGALWGSSDDPLTIANSILFGNAPQPEIYGFGATSLQFSDVCTEAGGAAVPPDAGNICANPQLNPDGSETIDSPTEDAGSNALVPAGLTTDIAGNPRILPSHLGCSGPLPAVVDMGAFEATFPGAAPACAPRTPSVKPVTAVIASNAIGNRLLQLTAPTACTAPAALLSLKVQSIARSGKGLVSYKVTHVAFYVDGGLKTKILIGKPPRRHHKTIDEPQFQANTLPSTFKFLPSKIGAHPGENTVVVEVALVTHTGKGQHRRTLRVTKTLKSTFEVC